MRAWIGLGGNFSGSRGSIETALHDLNEHPAVELKAVSGMYRSAAWGLTDQADFVNAVAELDTRLEPLQLLDFLQLCETRLGRRRDGPKWGPREIDLDLLLYENLLQADDRLTLPHPRMHQRAFVLIPLLELDPEAVIPGQGTASEWLARLDAEEVDSVRRLEPIS